MPKAGGLQQEWQVEAWHFLDTVGELAFANQWVANALSRVTLEVHEVMPDRSMQPTTSVEAIAAMDDLFHGETGQQQMMHAFGFHLTTPGESYVVGTPPSDDAPDTADGDTWRVLSNREIRQQAGQWIIDRGDGREEKYADGSKEGVPAEALVIRVWRPHPALWVEATSPVRGALPILRELEGLTKDVASSVDSRLAGAGLLVIPKEATFETPIEANQDPDDPEQNTLIRTLGEAMLTPIRDRGNAAARVPIVLSMPGELVDKVQHISFGLELSEANQKLREEAIRRLALSLDMPPEVLLGQADSNHWSAWLISEDAIKVHIEPLVQLICDALTQKYLWPVLAGVGWEPDAPIPPEVTRFRIIGDTSKLRQRPERTSEAMDLHGRMVLTDAALARETGFEESDLLKPTDPEYRRRMLQNIAGGVTTADLTAAAMKALGVEVAPIPSEVTPDAATGTAVAAPPAPAAIDAPRTPPSREESTAGIAAAAVTQAMGGEPRTRDALLASAELLVTRALERAHARLFGRGKGRKRAMTDAAKVDAALVDAWVAVPTTAQLLGVQPDMLLDTCDRYTRELLARGMDHHHDLLAAVVDHMLTAGATSSG